jgi:hypothetical protein
VFFNDGEMQFTKVQENGFYVYKSEPFTSSIDFEYELVNVQYTIKHGKGLRDGYPDSGTVFSEFTTGNHLCFILPGGKAIEQNPDIEKVTKQGKWTNANGREFAKTLVVTIANDPAQQVAQIIFVPDVVKVATGDPNNPVKYVQLPTLELVKTHFNQNNGVARFSSDKIEPLYDDADTVPWEWSSSGVIYMVDGNGVRKWIQGKTQELAK